MKYMHFTYRQSFSAEHRLLKFSIGPENAETKVENVMKNDAEIQEYAKGLIADGTVNIAEIQDFAKKIETRVRATDVKLAEELKGRMSPQFIVDKAQNADLISAEQAATILGVINKPALGNVRIASKDADSMGPPVVNRDNKLVYNPGEGQEWIESNPVQEVETLIRAFQRSRDTKEKNSLKGQLVHLQDVIRKKMNELRDSKNSLRPKNESGADRAARQALMRIDAMKGGGEGGSASARQYTADRLQREVSRIQQEQSKLDQEIEAMRPALQKISDFMRTARNFSPGMQKLRKVLETVPTWWVAKDENGEYKTINAHEWARANMNEDLEMGGWETVAKMLSDRGAIPMRDARGKGIQITGRQLKMVPKFNPKPAEDFEPNAKDAKNAKNGRERKEDKNSPSLIGSEAYLNELEGIMKTGKPGNDALVEMRKRYPDLHGEASDLEKKNPDMYDNIMRKQEQDALVIVYDRMKGRIHNDIAFPKDAQNREEVAKFQRDKFRPYNEEVGSLVNASQVEKFMKRLGSEVYPHDAQWRVTDIGGGKKIVEFSHSKLEGKIAGGIIENGKVVSDFYEYGKLRTELTKVKRILEAADNANDVLPRSVLETILTTEERNMVNLKLEKIEDRGLLEKNLLSIREKVRLWEALKKKNSVKEEDIAKVIMDSALQNGVAKQQVVNYYLRDVKGRTKDQATAIVDNAMEIARKKNFNVI